MRAASIHEDDASRVWDVESLAEPAQHSCLSNLIDKVFTKSRRLSPSAVMFTSPHRRAGVSFLCSIVAAELALQGDKVLLIDAHALIALRSSSPQSVLAMCRRVGPSLWVLGMKEALGRNVGLEGGSFAVGKQLRELEKAFAFVVVDAPALSAEMDAKLLAEDVYGIVIVARANQTRDEELKRHCHALTSFGGRILGSVFNAH